MVQIGPSKLRTGRFGAATGGGNTTINATIHVNAAPGQDVGALARKVAVELKKLSRPLRGAELHDGGEFDAA